MKVEIFVCVMSLMIITLSGIVQPFVLPPPETVTVEMIKNIDPEMFKPEMLSQLPPGYVDKLSPDVIAVLPDDIKQQIIQGQITSMINNDEINKLKLTIIPGILNGTDTNTTKTNNRIISQNDIETSSYNKNEIFTIQLLMILSFFYFV